jgi:hypothetical protein
LGWFQAANWRGVLLFTTLKDPAFLFYSSDFISGTLTMTDEQVGKYIRLICLQHMKGELSEKDMLFICKSHDEDIWNKFERTAAGTFINRRLQEVIEKRKNYSESRRKNRAGKTKDVNDTSLTYDNHMGNGNGNEIRKEKKGGAGGKKNSKQEEPIEIPTLEQLISYADEKGFTDGIAYEFFEKYTNLQWKKKIGGEPVANWKLTMQTWMKRDYNAKWKKPVQSTRYQTYNPDIHK